MQALACQEGPGPTKTGTDQTTGMPIKPVLQLFQSHRACHSWLGVVEGPGDRETESAEDNTAVPDVSPWAQFRSLSPLTGSQLPWDTREHSPLLHLASSTEQTEAGWETPASEGQPWQSPRKRRGRSGTPPLSDHLPQARDLVSN